MFCWHQQKKKLLILGKTCIFENLFLGEMVKIITFCFDFLKLKILKNTYFPGFFLTTTLPKTEKLRCYYMTSSNIGTIFLCWRNISNNGYLLDVNGWKVLTWLCFLKSYIKKTQLPNLLSFFDEILHEKYDSFSKSNPRRTENDFSFLFELSKNQNLKA